MARKGRARRFREARELKQGFDDGLFREGSSSLADITNADGTVAAEVEEWDDDAYDPAFDEEDPLLMDEGTTR
ncbi:MAG: hypothetical protein WBD02_10250 [Acidimicrobiia bacterium]